MKARNSTSYGQLISACFGNLLEHYDTALFGFLSPFLAPLIFPEKDPMTALLLTYAMIPLGMLARPLGSILFGYIGDRYGRGKALFLTLLGMSIISCIIAFSPTYAQAGFLAPLIFCIGRVLQNFFSSGETIGGAIFLLENTPSKRHDLLSSLYNASTVGGILLASFGVSVLSFYSDIEITWRLLYLFGCLTALAGIIVRGKGSSHTPLAPTSPKELLATLAKTFWNHKKALGIIALSSGFSYASYSIALIFLNGFIPLVSTFTKTEMAALNTLLLLLDFCILPLFGYIASKIKREKLMLISSFSVLLFAPFLFLLLENATLATIIFVRASFVLLGVAFSAPFHSFAQQIVPPAHRYTIISFGYALGSQAIGGPTAALSLWCFKTTNVLISASLYWVGLASICSLLLAIRLKRQKTIATLGENP
ncbi:MAG: MFS transporter [Chlamydiales bacterium]|nr:MFS transporter [Chlamydiales bacterium]